MIHPMSTMPTKLMAYMEICSAETMGYDAASICRMAEELAVESGDDVVDTEHVEDALELLGINPDVDATIADEGGNNA